MLQGFHDRIATGEFTAICTAALLRCGKETANLSQYYFSWIVSFYKQRQNSGLWN